MQEPHKNPEPEVSENMRIAADLRKWASDNANTHGRTGNETIARAIAAGLYELAAAIRELAEPHETIELSGIEMKAETNQAFHAFPIYQCPASIGAPKKHSWHLWTDVSSGNQYYCEGTV